MKTILIVAPHPDDEILGCGGYILKNVLLDNHVYVLYVTSTLISSTSIWPEQYVIKKRQEKESVFLKLNELGIHSLYLDFPAASLENIPIGQLISNFQAVFEDISPNIVLLPHPGDIHSDHTITFNVVSKLCKPFRQSCIDIIMCYETISETDLSIDPRYKPFQPNYYSTLTHSLLRDKLKLLSIYESEIGHFPFPRSYSALVSLAKTRGVQAGKKYAEAFQLIKWID